MNMQGFLGDTVSSMNTEDRLGVKPQKQWICPQGAASEQSVVCPLTPSTQVPKAGGSLTEQP